MRVAGSSRKDAKGAKTQRRGGMIKFREWGSRLCVFATFAPLREILILAITLACIFDITSLGQES